MIPYLAAGIADRMGCYWIFEVPPARTSSRLAAQ
jgi:hypothetical protein